MFSSFIPINKVTLSGQNALQRHSQCNSNSNQTGLNFTFAIYLHSCGGMMGYRLRHRAHGFRHCDADVAIKRARAKCTCVCCGGGGVGALSVLYGLANFQYSL